MLGRFAMSSGLVSTSREVREQEEGELRIFLEHLRILQDVNKFNAGSSIAESLETITQNPVTDPLLLVSLRNTSAPQM